MNYKQNYKKLQILLFLLIINISAIAQDELKLPNYTPASPEASAITKYADLQANEFKGMVSHSIPLHIYRAGHLEVPISINYNGAGVRIDDLPTWVGINFTLNAGGVITRTVKDSPDEVLIERFMPTEAEIISFNAVADGSAQSNFLWSVAESTQQIDSEVDIFQFNFNGYSGSFYFDENWNGKPLYDEQNLKITAIDRLQMLTSKFIYITTPDGIKYTFGGQNATEETSLRNVVNGNVSGNDTVEGTTAYYLINIEHPLHGNINFIYENLSEEICTTQKIKKFRKTQLYEYHLHHGTCGIALPFCDEESSDKFDCLNREEIEEVLTNVTISSRVLNPKYLKKIESANTQETIEFVSERVVNPSFKRVLNTIIIDKDSNSSNTPFQTIDFEYIGFSQNPQPSATTRYAEKRFFLKKIHFDKDNEYSPNTQYGRRNQMYEFEYNNPNALPNRFSYAQDYGGYYNGITANITSIPENIAFNPFGLNSFADRSTSFEHAVCGTLKRIYYPTRGFTEFEYESTRKSKKKNYKGITLYSWRNMNQYNFVANNFNDGIPQIASDGNYIGIQNVFEPQAVSINVKLKVHREQGDVISNQNERATVTIKDLTNPNLAITSHLLTFNSDSSGLTNVGIVEKEFSFSHSLSQGHEYEIKLVIDPTTSSDPIGMEGYLVLDYFDGYTVVDDFGIRLKRMTDYAEENKPENIKRYYYSSIENATAPINIATLHIFGE